MHNCPIHQRILSTAIENVPKKAAKEQTLVIQNRMNEERAGR